MRFTPSADAKTRPRPTIALAAYPGTSNRIETVTCGAQTVRVLSYDAAGDITADARSGSTYAYTYNGAGRLMTASYEGNLEGTYTYNGLEQLITRVISNSGTLDGSRPDRPSPCEDVNRRRQRKAPYRPRPLRQWSCPEFFALRSWLSGVRPGLRR